MVSRLGKTLMHAWNVVAREEKRHDRGMLGPAHSVQPDRPRVTYQNERTIITSIYTRMAVDVAGVRLEHCLVDEDGNYIEKAKSGLNECLNVEANIDQGGRHFRQTLALTMFDKGVVAIVPVKTDLDPMLGDTWDVRSLRIGEILEWYPQHVRVRVWDEDFGLFKDLTLPKRIVAIVENPFYAVMNEPNSTLRRLTHKLGLLDHIDEISSQGKLDIIIQLPYAVKSETRKAQAKARTEEIQDQLKSSTYGIAYTDGTEKITQLNRSVENNLLGQVKYLKEELYAELGLTTSIMDGTADDVTMLNYTNRIIEPVMDAISEAMTRTFLSKNARGRGHTVMYFQTPFKLIPISQLANLVDVFSRNQILTPNEVRPTLGLKPSKEPQANQLINSNMPLDQQVTSGGEGVDDYDPDGEEAELDESMGRLGL